MTFLHLHPNPARVSFRISTTGKVSDFNQYEIIDITGRSIQKGILTSPSTEVIIQNIPGGIYSVQLTNGINRASKRIILL